MASFSRERLFMIGRCDGQPWEVTKPGSNKATRMYKRAGKDGQKIAEHASENMTKNYQKDHVDVVWSEVEADLHIAEFAGWFCANFARFLRRHKKADLSDRLKCLILLRNNGRDGVIRTLDPLHPMQVRYRAALRPD